MGPEKPPRKVNNCHGPLISGDLRGKHYKTCPKCPLLQLPNLNVVVNPERPACNGEVREACLEEFNLLRSQTSP